MKGIVLAAVAALLACPVQAQGGKCLPRSELVEDLASKHGERLAGGGL